MVVGIEGIITKKEPTFIIVKCASGLSYGIFISLFCSAKIQTQEKHEFLSLKSSKKILINFMASWIKMNKKCLKCF